MRRLLSLATLLLVSLSALAPDAWAQSRPYIGFVYPAGGQQSTTFQVKIGGQNLSGLDGVVVSGAGVSARVVEYLNPLGNTEMALLSQQLRELKRTKSKTASTKKTKAAAASSEEMMMVQAVQTGPTAAINNEARAELIARIEKRIREDQKRPACAALRNLAFIEVTIAPDAAPGEREMRLVTSRGGASNPLPFYVGHLPEYSRKPMLTAPRSVLGKEEQAQRRRPAEEVEDRINIPCTVNGQIACGEINRYRFEARKGQRLVISALARQLVPYVADAVPGWFQPVLALYDASGNELAYNDDYRFRPDPTIVYQIPKDGEYVFTITDAIYRGREDFVYRVSIGDLPLVTSIFPIGGVAGKKHSVKMQGWNLDGAAMWLPGADASPGVYLVAASKQGVYSNDVRFALGTLPEISEKEPNDSVAKAQRVKIPGIINGRINQPDDWDVFQIEGKAGEQVAAEVFARRLDSPMDSVLKVTDATGKVLAFNDDHRDLGAGVNTHHADSYLMFELPADGKCQVHVGDTAAAGGDEYAYRLRISAPRPDFALRVVPSSLAMKAKSSATVTVYAIRKDGFNGPIKLGLKDPPDGFSAAATVLPANQDVVRFTIKSQLPTGQPVALTVEGRGEASGQEIVHEAVPAEDRMQAFLWRHLVPAQEFLAFVYDPSYKAPPGREPPELTPAQLAKAKAIVAEAEAAGRKFTKSQVAGRVRTIKSLYALGLLTDEFYGEKVAECGAVD